MSKPFVCECGHLRPTHIYSHQYPGSRCMGNGCQCTAWKLPESIREMVREYNALPDGSTVVMTQRLQNGVLLQGVLPMSGLVRPNVRRAALGFPPYQGEEMRNYAALYNKHTDTWSVIFQDDLEKEWYIHIPDAGSQDTANGVAESLNLQNARNR